LARYLVSGPDEQLALFSGEHALARSQGCSVTHRPEAIVPRVGR
jgi:hypothetical protein